MKISHYPSMRTQAGFTLIELIVVIVILGILAATALPKFSDLSGDARRASLKAARGALETVSVTTHSKSLLTGSPTASVDLEGTAVAMVNGYPSSAGTTATAAGLTAADYVITTNGRDLIVSPNGAKTPASCKVTYSEAVVDNGVLTPAKTATLDTGC